MASNPAAPDRSAAREPMTPDQKLTISGLYRPGWHSFPNQHRVPLLQLAGTWLAEAGFTVGGEVRVRAEYGRLVVTLRDVDGEEG